MYKEADKVIRYLNKRFIRIFSKAKALSSFDELNVLNYSGAMYEELARITYEHLWGLAQRVHREHGGWGLEEAWFLGLLEEYDPVTKYVYAHEVDRKRARFAESVIASPSKQKEVETALRLWSQMINQYAIIVTDAAVIKAYEDRGVREVVWITIPDERRCKICRGRHGKKYKIDKLPAKPHWGCRCYFVPAMEYRP